MIIRPPKNILLSFSIFAGALISIPCLAQVTNPAEGPAPSVAKSVKKTVTVAYSLPRLVELAEANAPLIQKAKSNLEIATLEYSNSKSKFFPTLDISATHGIADTDPSVKSTAAVSDLTLTAKESFYDNGASFTRWRQASRKHDRFKLEYELARDEQYLKVAQAFFDWSTSKGLREIDENKRDLLQRQFNILEAQYKQGIKTKRDVLRIETEVRRLQIAILERDNEVDLNFQKLATAIGVSREQLDKEAVSPEEAKITKVPEKVLPLKSEEHKRAKVYTLREQEAAFDTDLVERDYWPQVSLNGELTYAKRDYIETSTSFDEAKFLGWSILLVAKYNLWDFGIKRRELQISRMKTRLVENESKEKLLDLDVELKEVSLKLWQFAVNAKTTRELLSLEQQSYSILETEYRNARASYLDLITNLNSLIDARSKYITSYFGLRKQQMLYSFHRGDLNETVKQK